MYLKEEIVFVDKPIIYLRYCMVAGTLIDVYLYDNVKKENIYRLDRIYSLHNSILESQFSIDEDKSMIYLAFSSSGIYIRVLYYTEGKDNVYYIGGNMDRFLVRMLQWSETRVVDGLFVYWTPEEEGQPIKHIKAGSFIYQGELYVYPGGVFDIRQQAPPTIKETFRSYLLFVNGEWLSNNVYRQSKVLNRIGIIHSDCTDNDVWVTLQDVNAKYDRLYNSEPLNIAHIHVYLMSNLDYEVWVEYPREARVI